MKQTRTSRKNGINSTEPNKDKKPKGNGPEKIYYAIIAVLLVILVGIMVFIFMNRDTGVNLNADNGTPDSEVLTDLDEEEDAEEETDTEDVEEDTEEEADNQETENEEEETDQPDEDADTEEDSPADTEEDSEEDTEDTEFEVTDSAPLDESYNVNYGEGSSDRVAIANAVSTVTGLDQSSMITWRVGNNGPGRVFAIMSDRGQDNVYRVFLQYGEGQWHVTEVEELSAVPAEYR